MKKSKSAGIMISQEQAIKQIEISYTKKLAELETKEKETSNLISRSEIKHKKLNLRLDLNTAIQNQVNLHKRRRLEQKLEKCLELKTERRREILREITEKNNKHEPAVKLRKQKFEEKEKEKLNDYFNKQGLGQSSSNIHNSLIGKDSFSKFNQKSKEEDKLHKEKEISIQESKDNYRINISRKDDQRLKTLSQLLERPGSTRWLTSTSGGRLKTVYTSLPSSITVTPRSLPIWDCINGYTGASLTSRTSSVPLDGEYVMKDHSLKKVCYKLTPNDSVLTIDHAMLYLRLRGHGCPKDEAMIFSSRQRCRTDSTLKFDGPVHHRVLKRVDNSNQGPS